MDNIAGSPVEGENFYARETDVMRLREILRNDDILLLGPRRIGKTSIARAVMTVVRAEGWRAIEINVASCQDERGFLDKLNSALKPELASLTDKAKGVIGDAFDAMGKRIKSVKVSIPGAGALGACRTWGVESENRPQRGQFFPDLQAHSPAMGQKDGEKWTAAVDLQPTIPKSDRLLDVGLGNSNTEDWTQVANDVLRLIARAEQRWLIYIDELPILLFNIIRADPANGVPRVRRFLDWFRNDVRAMPEVRTVRWLVSGSVGLDTLVQQHGMAETINSMKHEGLEAFSEDVATGMLAKLATTYTITLSNDDAQKIVAAVLWPQPYYLQLAFHHLRSLMTANPTVQAAVLIEQAIDKLVQPGGDNDFHHWESRLAIQLSAVDAGHSLALLNLAAQAPAGARPENLLAELQGRMPNATQEEARRAFITLRDILQRDAYWWPDESSGRRKWSIYRFWVRWRDAVQGALSAVWRATQARSNAAMRPVVRPKMGYWLFLPPSGVKRYRFRLEPLRRWWLRRNTL